MLKDRIVRGNPGWLKETMHHSRLSRDKTNTAKNNVAPWGVDPYELGVAARRAGRLSEAELYFRYSLQISQARREPGKLQMAETLYELGTCAREAGQLVESERYFRQALEIFEVQLGEDDPEVGVTLHALGVCWRDTGRLHEAERLLRRALKIFRMKLGREHLHVTVTLYELGLCVRNAGRLREAEAHLFQALDILELNPERDDLHMAETLHALALCARQAGRPEEAEFQLLGALDIKAAKLGPGHHQVGVTLHELGVCSLMAGRLENADSQLRRALGIFEATSGHSSLHVAGTLHSLGLCARKGCMLVEAEIHLRRARKIFEAKLGSHDLQVATTWHEMALCLREAGKQQEAEINFRRALDVLRQARTGSSHVQEASTLHELGVCFYQQGRLREAEAQFRGALTVSGAHLSSDDLEVAATLYELGVCLRAAGRLKDAEYHLCAALDILEARLGSDDLQVAETLRELGLCVKQAGQLSDADTYLRRAESIMETNLTPTRKQVPEAVRKFERSARRTGRPIQLRAHSSRAVSSKEARLGPLRDLAGSLRDVRQSGMDKAPVHIELKHLEAKRGENDERFVLNRRSRRDRFRDLHRDTARTAMKKWSSARSVFEDYTHGSGRKGLAKREAPKKETTGRQVHTKMVASAAGSASSRTIADADGGAGLPLRLSKRPSSASFKRIVQHRHRGHQKSSSVPADFTAGTVNRMQVKLDSFKGSSSGRSRGSLSLHAVGRLCHKSHFRGGRRGRQARVVLMPPSHVCPLAGPDVMLHYWRDEHGRVEVRTAPRDGKHVAFVRLLDKVYMEEISRSDETGSCLISPVIEGPGHARFSPGTATVSFYLGRCGDFVFGDCSENSRKGLETYALHTYFPVVKGDGVNQHWEEDGDFKVVWKGDELWLETALLHFCKRGVAKKSGRRWGPRLTRFWRGETAPTEPSIPSPPRCPNDQSVETGPLPHPPLGSARYPSGWAEFDNCTQTFLEVVVMPETFETEEPVTQPSRAHQPGVGKAAGSHVPERMSIERSKSVLRAPAPCFFGLTHVGVGPDESRGVVLPGAVQGRLLWCSVTEPLMPEDLPYGSSPNQLSEGRLGNLGYTVSGGLLLKRFFVEARSGRSHRSLLIVRVWDRTTVAPLTYNRITPKRLTQPCLWEAAVPSKADVGAKLNEYMASTTAPTP